MPKKIIALIPFLLITCKPDTKLDLKTIKDEKNIETVASSKNYLKPNAKTIIDRFLPEDGYKREKYKSTDFAYFLQHLPLKAINEKVTYFDGRSKDKPNVYNSVIDLPIGTKDLHQCADAAMRLRADYLYQQKRYDKIAFNFVSDGKPRDFVTYANGDYSPKNYWKYLEYIFSSANTASLKAQLKTINYQDVKIGDILIQKGNPYGHAVMVVDLITDGTIKKVLLAQSYMPAQELQILINPSNQNGSPWYEIKAGKISTPEWKFTSNDWKTWE